MENEKSSYIDKIFSVIYFSFAIFTILVYLFNFKILIFNKDYIPYLVFYDVLSFLGASVLLIFFQAFYKNKQDFNNSVLRFVGIFLSSIQVLLMFIIVGIIVILKPDLFFDAIIFLLLVFKSAVLFYRNPEEFYTRGTGLNMMVLVLVLAFAAAFAESFQAFDIKSDEFISGVFSTVFFGLYFLLISIFLLLPKERVLSILMNPGSAVKTKKEVWSINGTTYNSFSNVPGPDKQDFKNFFENKTNFQKILITINGRTYNSIDEMSEEDKKLYFKIQKKMKETV